MQQRSCCYVVNINFSACRPEVAGWIPGFISLFDETFKLWSCLNLTFAVGGTLLNVREKNIVRIRVKIWFAKVMARFYIHGEVLGGVYWNDYCTLLFSCVFHASFGTFNN